MNAFSQYKDENKDYKNDNNFSNEIMLSNIINDNEMKPEFLSSIPGIHTHIFQVFRFMLFFFCWVWQ